MRQPTAYSIGKGVGEEAVCMRNIREAAGSGMEVGGIWPLASKDIDKLVMAEGGLITTRLPPLLSQFAFTAIFLV